MSSPGSRTRVAILGVGLIGGSIGMALRASGSYEVVGWDIDTSVRGAALERGALDETAESPQSAVSRADLAILAAPVSSSIALVPAILSALSPDATVTDVCSTKAHITAEGVSRLGGRFVGGHPMAGSERSGVGAARPDLFRGAPWFLTPVASAREESLRLARTVVSACGAIPRLCAPDLHDQIVAALSHLPHLAAFGLSQVAADDVPAEWRDAAAGSFRDGTRVAASSPTLWADILTDNRYAVIPLLSAYEGWLHQVKTALEYRDRDRLLDLLERASGAKAAFPEGESMDG